MKFRTHTILIILLLGAVFSPIFFQSMAEDQPELDQGGWVKPGIDEVELELKNSTGFFRLELDAVGTSPEGTDSVEITFGGLNGTKIEVAENFWFKEGNQFLFIYGSTLEREDITHKWSNWSFNLWFSLPSSGGIDGAISQLGNMFGLDTGNISTEGVDLANISQALEENRFYLIARSYNETDAWGQEALDITDHLLTAILQFMIDEGMIPDPSVDDDEEPPVTDDDEKEKSSISPIILIGIFVLGIVSLIAVLCVVVYLAVFAKREKQ